MSAVRSQVHERRAFPMVLWTRQGGRQVYRIRASE